MSRSSDNVTARPARWRAALLPIAMTAAGFGLTLLIFYPGLMTIDARFIYDDIAIGFLGDWQSPVMAMLWKLIDPIAAGSASMFLLIASLYWLAFGMLALTIARRSGALAAALLILAASPPALVMLGMIWRDILFGGTWLMGAALAFTIADRWNRLRTFVQMLAAGLLAFGVLLRPNALVAAPVLFAYIAWPASFSWKRAAIVAAPAGIALFALLQLVYYGALGATRQ
jgi:hypothetical protein